MCSALPSAQLMYATVSRKPIHFTNLFVTSKKRNQNLQFTNLKCCWVLKGSLAFMQHFKLVNSWIRGFVFLCHEQVNQLLQSQLKVRIIVALRCGFIYHNFSSLALIHTANFSVIFWTSVVSLKARNQSGIHKFLSVLHVSMDDVDYFGLFHMGNEQV